MIAEDFILKNYNSNIERGAVKWESPSNIALVKYWGKKENQIPENPSISFTLSNCKTITKLTYTKKESKNFNSKPILESEVPKEIEIEKKESLVINPEINKKEVLKVE